MINIGNVMLNVKLLKQLRKCTRSYICSLVTWIVFGKPKSVKNVVSALVITLALMEHRKHAAAHIIVRRYLWPDFERGSSPTQWSIVTVQIPLELDIVAKLFGWAFLLLDIRDKSDKSRREGGARRSWRGERMRHFQRPVSPWQR